MKTTKRSSKEANKSLKKSRARPVRRRTQAERTNRSDLLLREAAMKLIAHSGTHNLTLKDVSKIAGYSRSQATARYGTKESLFADLISSAKQRWLTGLADSVGELRGIAALRAWAESMAEMFERDAESLRALYILCYETVGSSEIARNNVAEAHVVHRARLERWISDGIIDRTIRTDVSPKDAALHYTSLFYGLVYQWLVEPQQIDMVKALRQMTLDFSRIGEK